jgi:uncharacterized protein YyaL (SSP411 family)
MANRLINEQSPYLQQHANNPVDWYPWGNEAFDKAADEHKPVIVSIGYAACHWCHVMEHESFENAEVAAYMNEHFVCIKVDREEHPDVDHMYMDAVQAISGSGGWPLNVFVTPQRAPFYGGTYYPPKPAFNRPSWSQLLQRMNEIWHEQHDEVASQAEQMLQHLRNASLSGLGKTAAAPAKDTSHKIADTLLSQADKEKGGFGNAPKFPGTMAISFLLEHYHFTGYQASLDHALKSLDAMIAGGIYDQLTGGFARYSTDRNWLAPHFEKMLYDNALLVSTLCDAWHITKEDHYRQVVDQTIAFVEAELKDPSGGYYCALDADSEGEEGKFYTWTWDEWQAASGDVDGVAALHFGISVEGNREGTNILHIFMTPEEVAADKNMALEEVNSIIGRVRKNLLIKRTSRERPLTDDKSLLSWNALMNIALCKAGVAFSEGDNGQRYLRRASQHMGWMLAAFELNGALQHAWKNGVARIPAKLDDYAYLIQALLQLASATGENKWVLKANELLTITIGSFSRDDGFFYYTPEDQQDIPVRKVDLYDGATPSANAVMAHNLWICGMCMEETGWLARAVSMIHQMTDTASRYSYSFGYWSILLQRQVTGMKMVVLTGSEALKQGAGIARKYLPQAFMLTCEKEISELPVFQKKFFGDKMYIFVCTEKACLSPVNSVHEAFHLIDQ